MNLATCVNEDKTGFQKSESLSQNCFHANCLIKCNSMHYTFVTCFMFAVQMSESLADYL